MHSDIESIAKAFEHPAFYDHHVSEIERRETHISIVFLTGERVYKLKKPVNFGFLNYETPELRRFYCQQEVRLNQRLTTGIYLGTTSVCRNGRKTFYLGECEDPVECVVVMKQLPDKACFQKILESGSTGPESYSKIAKHLAGFYEKSTVTSPHLTKYGDLEYIRFNAYENFQQLRPFVGNVGSEDLLLWFKKAVHRFTLQNRSLFRNRVAGGFVKNGHGDLRAEHIYFYNGVQVLDCIEFNDRLRYGDVAVDMAFLFMDLTRLGYRDAALQIIDEYVNHSGDVQIWALLDFYTAYRALVRSKVACLETLGLSKEEASRKESLFGTARNFMKMALSHTAAFDTPVVITFMGLPASGKSAHASLVASYFHIDHISSDVIRKEVMPDATVSPFGQGAYSDDKKAMIYQLLAARCREGVKRGRSVVVDATFSLRKWRQIFSDRLKDLPCTVLWIETQAPLDALKNRLEKRSLRTGEASDARIEHLQAFLKTYEPPDELPERQVIRLSTEAGKRRTNMKLMRRLYELRLKLAGQMADQMWNRFVSENR
ncbi:MAG: AAA family ATPase [Deltaproteobacteria bacterium]|nr:AAA family ATPase [Deltaproteobacteria bacterium]MBW2067275.1 AAA family ATPase [Deltaproteobacteria bacterium]